MADQNVWLLYDNEFILLLKEDDVAYNLSSVTQIDLIFGEKIVSSTNQGTDPIRWSDGYDTGEIGCTLGGETIPAGSYTVYVAVYNATFAEGLIWGSLTCEVHEPGHSTSE